MSPRPATIGLETPEHTRLDLALGDLGSRFLAFVFDLTLQLVLVLVIALPLSLLESVSGAATALFVLLFFLVRNFYFTVAEVRGHGRTPGKKRLGLRVIARDGGPLTVEQVLARNLTRDIEIFLPLTVLVAPAALVPAAPPWAQVMIMLWVLVLTFLPAMNRHRARLGDLVAGTLVIAEPAAVLDHDLSQLDPARDHAAVAAYRFTDAQLSVYGIRELQVLEDALRRPPSGHRDRLLDSIAEKIRSKIDWDPHRALDVGLFLQAFYTAQRAHLEKKLLFGSRRERKIR